jgi:hypothetical protein
MRGHNDDQMEDASNGLRKFRKYGKPQATTSVSPAAVFGRFFSAWTKAFSSFAWAFLQLLRVPGAIALELAGDDVLVQRRDHDLDIVVSDRLEPVDEILLVVRGCLGLRLGTGDATRELIYGRDGSTGRGDSSGALQKGTAVRSAVRECHVWPF